MTIRAGVETFNARCETCDRHWHATGTVNSRRAHRQAQRHSDRTGHLIQAEWANRQPQPPRSRGVLGT